MEKRSFKEIFEEKIRQNPVLSEETPSAPPSWDWNIKEAQFFSDFNFSGKFDNLIMKMKGHSHYSRFCSPPEPPHPPEHFSQEQKTAFEFFYQQGVFLKPNFSKGEAKKAFHKLARKLHPDTADAQNELRLTELFKQLMKAYEILNEAVS